MQLQDVNYTSLPGGLTASKNSSAKTLTISGTPTQNGSFSVSTVGGNSSVTLNASITLKVPGSILADWYPFQENPVTLRFLSFSNATLDISFYDDSKPSNGVTYTSGALRLNKGDAAARLELKSLDG